MVRTARTIEPNEANARRYDTFYPQYRHLYAALKEVRETGTHDRRQAYPAERDSGLS